MNMFKIRYSHGKVGNDNIGDNNRFPYLYTIATTGYNSEGKPNYVYNWGFGDYGKSFIGTHYTQMASNGITWEVATKDDWGLIFLCLMTNLQRQLTISTKNVQVFF